MKKRNIEYEGYNVTIKEDDENYYIDFNTGLGKGIYPKKDWTLARALYHQSIQNYKREIEDNDDIYEW